MRRQVGKEDVPGRIRLVNQFVAAAPVRMDRGEVPAVRVENLFPIRLETNPQKRTRTLAEGRTSRR